MRLPVKQPVQLEELGGSSDQEKKGTQNSCHVKETKNTIENIACGKY